MTAQLQRGRLRLDDVSRTPTSSVRLARTFMQVGGRGQGLDDVLGDETRQSRPDQYKARELLRRKIAEGTHICGEYPGVQFDCTINSFNTCANDGPHPRLQPLLRVHVPGRHGLQPGLHQPAQVPAGGQQLRRGRFPPHRAASCSWPRKRWWIFQLPHRTHHPATPTVSGPWAWATPTWEHCS